MNHTERLLAITTLLLADPKPDEQDQFRLLSALVVSWIQRYATNKPLALSEFVRMLRENV